MAAIVEARRRGVGLRALAKQYRIGVEQLKALAPPEVAPVEERRGVRPIYAAELAQMFAERVEGASWLSIAERHRIGIRRVKGIVTPDPKPRRQPQPQPQPQPEPDMNAFIDALLEQLPEPAKEATRAPAPPSENAMPDINQYDLDAAVPHGGEPLGWPMMEEAIVDAKDEFEVEGAAAVFSTYLSEAAIVDGTMQSERAAALLAHLPAGGRYHVRVQLINADYDFDGAVNGFRIVDHGEPLRKRAHERKLLTITTRSKPGLLVGVDVLWYQKAYPNAAVVYGLFPMREPDAALLRPMHEGELNCVAEKLLAFFRDARRGEGLTERRNLLVRGWAAEVQERGATIEDVKRLERMIRRRIVISDLTGTPIYGGTDSYKSNNYKTVELTCHNGHAWGDELRFPEVRRVEIFDGDIWEAIRAATASEPLAVWLVGSEHAPSQFVLKDGRVFRHRELHDAIMEAARGLGVHGDELEALAVKAFGANHAATIDARERNGWRPTADSVLADVQAACVEHRHGGLWNAPNYDPADVVCLDMKACYPASFVGEGEAEPWFARFGHPGSHFARVAVNGPLPARDLTGFAQVRSWRFADGLHPVFAAWYGTHFGERKWAPMALLSYLVERGHLVEIEVAELIVSLDKPQRDVCLPQQRDLGCSVIGKFTQGAKCDGKRLTQRLVVDAAELDFLVKSCHDADVLLGTKKCPAGHIIQYFTGSCPQYAHLRASMLAYAHINLLEMVSRFHSEEVSRIATDSIYVRRSAIRNLDGCHAYVAPRAAPKECGCGAVECIDCLLEEVTEAAPVRPIDADVAPAQWRDKGEAIRGAQDHAAYTSSEHVAGVNEKVQPSEAPSAADPLATHRVCYLNGGGGSGKTTRAIRLMKCRKPVVFTHKHRLAREHRERHDVAARTYHSFFKWCGAKKGPDGMVADVWTPERMGDSYVPRVVILDEVCTVPRQTLETFLGFLKERGCQVILCGDQGQPPPITGESPNEWLRATADHYEEVETDYRAKDEPLRALKWQMRLQSDRVACEAMREAIPALSQWAGLLRDWTPRDSLLVSRTAMRERILEALFALHKEKHAAEFVPILYHPKDSRKQNVEVSILGCQGRREMLAKNDVVEVPMAAALEASKHPDWRLGYAQTIHSSQGLTNEAPRRVWIVDDRVSWSNLAYLAVSRVEFLNQLIIVEPPPEEAPKEAPRELTPEELRRAIVQKVVYYKKQDREKGRDLAGYVKLEDVLRLREEQKDACACCNRPLLWRYELLEDGQLTLDRQDNTRAHLAGNLRLACLACNRTRGFGA